MYLKEIKIEKEEETQQGDFETLGVSGKRRPSSPSPERPGEWPGDVFPPLFNEELANLVAGFWRVVSTHAEAVLLSILKQFLKRCLWILKAMLVDMYARAWPPSASGAPGLSAPRSLREECVRTGHVACRSAKLRYFRYRTDSVTRQ